MHRVLLLAAIALLAGCSIDILHDIPESQANEVVAVLQREGVSADKARVSEGSGTSYTISVRRGDAPTAWRILRQKQLPRTQEQGLGEVFGDLGLVPTTTQEHALLRHALAGEISRTLNSIDGVRQARVHIVLPDRDPLTPRNQPGPDPRAAVLLQVDGKLAVSETDVRKLVAGSVEGLAPRAVNVVISRLNSTSNADNDDVLVSLGPFRVAARSRTALTVLLVAMVLLLLLLALLCLLLLRAYRSLKRRKGAAAPPGGPVSVSTSMALLERSLSRRP